MCVCVCVCEGYHMNNFPHYQTSVCMSGRPSLREWLMSDILVAVCFYTQLFGQLLSFPNHFTSLPRQAFHGLYFVSVFCCETKGKR